MKRFYFVIFCLCFTMQNFYAQSPQTLTGATAITCPQDNILTLQSSEAGVTYFLYNKNSKSYVNSKVGTGNSLTFQTGVIQETTEFQVDALTNNNTAVDFDGTNDYIEVPNSVIPTSGNFSIAFWVKLHSVQGTFREFFSQGTAGNAVYISGTRGQIIRAGDDWQNTGFTYPDDANWHHIALVKYGVNTYLYFDGIEVAGQVNNAIDNPANTVFRLGRQYGNFNDNMHGEIDHFSVWNKALSTAEILTNKDNLLVGNEANLVAYYNFNDNKGLTLTDVTGNGHNGSLLPNMDGGITNPTNFPNGDWVPGKPIKISNTQIITYNTPTIVYVDATATGTTCGGSWANAKTNIQDAVNAVATNGQVLIATGTYKEGSEITINKALTIKGGYPTGGGTQDIANNATILDGNTTHRVLRAIHTSGTLFLEGLTIQRGHANNHGAGIYTTGNLDLKQVVVSINQTTITSSASVSLEVFGGGIHGTNITVTNSKITSNNASAFNNTCSPLPRTSIAYGGGVYGTNITVTNSQITNNSIFTFVCSSQSKFNSFGGGIYGANITVINSKVASNTAFSSISGSGINVPDSSRGGGIYGATTITLTNSLVTNNSVASDLYFFGGGVHGTTILQNSILWGNTKREFSNANFVPSEHESGTLTANYSLIKSQNPAGTANIDATVGGFNPLFVDEANGNYRLQAGSPLINTGNNSYNSTTLDLNNNSRIYNTTIDIGPYEYDQPITNWLGASTIWDNDTNWDNGVPTASKSAFIGTGKPNNPTINTSANAKDINIQTGASLEITAENSLTTHRNLLANNNVIVKSNATTNGSLIVNGTASGNITYNRHVTDNWHTVGAPVIGQNINTFAVTNTATNQIIQNGDNTKYAIAPYNNNIPINNWEYVTVANIATAGNFTNGKGYAMKRNSAGIYSFTGTIENDDKTLTLTDGSKNNWNLIANPYPSFLKLNNLADASANLLLQNTANLNLSNLAIYIWDTPTTSYKPYTHASTNLQYLAPGQAFFVNVKNGGGTFTFPKNLQTHHTGNLFAKNANPIFEIILKISDGKQTKSTEIKYLQNTTKGLDVGYDAEMFNAEDTSFEIYTQLLVNNQNKPIALQCLPPTNFEEHIIPIGVNADANATINFTIDVQNIPNGINIYLEDRIENIFMKLNDTNQAYEITIAATQSGVGRFYIHTNSQTLSTENFSTPLEQTKIWLSDKRTLRISNLPSEKAVVKLYDLLGKEVFKTKFKAESINTIVVPNNLQQAVYIVRLQTEKWVKTQKIILQ